jgi:TolB protein
MCRFRIILVTACTVTAVSTPALMAVMQSPPAAPAPSNSAPVVSPDGTLVAFVSNRAGNPDLFVVPAGGGAERQLTRTAEPEGRPDWSADGKRLFYSIVMQDVSRLYALELATGQSAEIGRLTARGGTVAPDGTRVAYTAGTWQASRLAVAGLDGSNERLLTTAEQTGVAWNARFSPDGQHIAFTGQDANKQLQVFVVSVNGTRVRQMTRFTRDQGRGQVPAWAPDGRQIAFQVNRTPGVCDIWRVAIDGGEPTVVVRADGAVLNEVPAWFPSGQRLAFQSNRSGRMEIWSVNVDGTNARQITGGGH